MGQRSRFIVAWFTISAGTLWCGAVHHGWQEKAFKDWTKEDAQAVMNDSPWVKHVPAPAGSRPPVLVMEPGAAGAAPPSASLGNPQNTTTGTNMTVAANSGSAGGADPSGTHNLPNTHTPSSVPLSAGAPEIGRPLAIIWASAAPVRLAILKLRSGTEAVDEALISRAQEKHSYYTVAVSGLPAPESDDEIKTLPQKAFLKVASKGAVVASDVNYRKIGDSDVYFFRFKRTDLLLTLPDKEVEFKAGFGTIEVRKKFILKEMQYGGELAL